VFTSLPGVTAGERLAELHVNGPLSMQRYVLVTFDITAMFGYSAVGAVAIAIFHLQKLLTC